MDSDSLKDALTALIDDLVFQRAGLILLSRRVGDGVDSLSAQSAMKAEIEEQRKAYESLYAKVNAL